MYFKKLLFSLDKQNLRKFFHTMSSAHYVSPTAGTNGDTLRVTSTTDKVALVTLVDLDRSHHHLEADGTLITIDDVLGVQILLNNRDIRF